MKNNFGDIEEFGDEKSYSCKKMVMKNTGQNILVILKTGQNILVILQMLPKEKWHKAMR